jgi:ketosteroid isomerase-like protein
MAEGKREVVSQRLTLRASGRRRLLERLYLRFPGFGERTARAVLRLPPTSPIRRRMVGLMVSWALEAANREDFEAAFALLPAGYVTVTPPELAGLGLEASYRGREGRLTLQRAWMRDLGEFQQDAEGVIDTGDRIVVLGQMMGAGLGSGANFESEVAYVITVGEGRLVREQLFRSHAEALEAAGLRSGR